MRAKDTRTPTPDHPLPAVLKPLMDLPHWVIWRWEKRKNKNAKVPYAVQAPARKAEADNPATWATYQEAVAVVAAGQAAGIGFVLTDTDYAALDLDQCRNKETGKIEAWAQTLIDNAQSYTEVSVSGTGLHIIGYGEGSKQHRKFAQSTGGSCEVYRKATRFLYMSGQQIGDAGLINIDAVIDAVVAEFELPADNDTTEYSNELPPMVRSLLHIANLGANHPHGGYPSRSELLFAFLTSALRAGVADTTSFNACLDNSFVGRAIYQHCLENGGRSYLRRQITKAKQKVREARSEMLTDLGNARRLVRLYGEDLRYVHAWGKWLIWKNGHWRRDDDGAVMRMAKAAVEQMFAEAARINDETRRNAMRSYALKSQSAQRLVAMVKLAESESEVVLAIDKLDADPYLLGVRNGVIDLRAVKFREANRDDYITKLAGVAFDAEAQCPNWIAFLNKILCKDDELIRYFQRATGYCLTGLTSEEVLFVLYGLGSNGKSTLRETIFAMFGDYAIGSDRNLLIANQRSGGASPDLARLHGCRLVTINETKQNDILDDARVKFITSHDVITARNLYEGLFDFTPTHKAMLTTNHKPIIKGSDEGIWRRIHLWPFVFKFAKEERDKLFRERVLIPELPGILNWSLQGLKAYWQEGLNPPKAVMEATNEYREAMDLIGNWIEERCELDPEAKTRSSDLHVDYKFWAEREVGFAVSTVAFGRELSEREFKMAKVEGSRGFVGIKLKSELF